MTTLLELSRVCGKAPTLDVRPIAHGLGRAVKAGGAPAAQAFVRVAQAVGERWMAGWGLETWAELSTAVGAWDDADALRRAVAIVEQVRDALAAFVSAGGLHGHGVEGLVDSYANYSVFTVVFAALYHGLRSRLAELSQGAAAVPGSVNHAEAGAT
jgi:hypothetical protein